MCEWARGDGQCLFCPVKKDGRMEKNMDVILVMCAGVLVGRRFFPEKYRKINEKIQVACTVLLIFSMGVMLGQRDNFLEELSSLGIQSFLFFLVPTVCSVILVYVLTQAFMKKSGPEKGKRTEEKQTEEKQTGGKR